MRLSKQIAIGLMLLFLAACSTPSPAPTVQQAKPDPAWTEPVLVPQLQGRDNAALASWAKALRDALDEANANLSAIKAWAGKL